VNSYNIVIIQPPDFQPVPAYEEVARLLNLSFETLAISSKVSINRLSASGINIILGYQFLPASKAPTLPPYIVYQTEQLMGHPPDQPLRGQAVLRNALEVWDSSTDNFEVLKTLGCKNIKYLPMGYHPEMITIPQRPEIEKTIDVLFYGILSTRRLYILDGLRRACRYHGLSGVYGDQLGEWISRAKVVLNMHISAATTEEQTRVFPLLTNGCFVVSEESTDNPYDGCVVRCHYDKIVDTCMEYITKPDERARFSAKAHAVFAATLMADSLKTVLGPAIKV
jgi:hypothetical protein